MKKISFIIIAIIGIVMMSCRNKELCEVPHYTRTTARVIVHWDNEELATKPAYGMRTNYFPTATDVFPEIWDLPGTDTDSVRLKRNAEYAGICYDYYINEIYFKNENSFTGVEAYSTQITRATYSRAYPNETTRAEPSYPFYVGTGDAEPNDYPARTFFNDGNDIHFYPKNVVKVYTFEIRDVEGSKYIEDTRGGITGMSGSYFMGTGLLATAPSTILFYAAKTNDDRIVGRFYTFGPITSNNFTIEILCGDIYSGIWDVSNQVLAAFCLNDPANPDIIIYNDGQIPPLYPHDPDGDSTFDVTIDDWTDVVVQIPM